LGSKKFDDAKAKVLMLALLVKDEQYPKDKIKETDKMIADELAAMGAKEAAEKSCQKEAEYTALIKEGGCCFER